MTGSRPDNEAIFHAARDLPDPDRRREYVREACGGDETRIAHVEALLAAADAPDSLLDRPAGGNSGATIDELAPERPGKVIGPYKLIQQIGEGGMGTVWMAQQQESVRRLVALKVIKPGMDSRQVIARFEAERQALAMMDHPNIAKIFEAGTTAEGRPFFVMELVRGVPITKYCDERKLTLKERLELFIPVCQAVQHAHQKGIIHRDLKPGNVLVALFDGQPVPKVIDFGVAKAAGQPLTDKTLVTGFGAVVGTLEYMSPEQAELNQLDIDTRSDIYSLGVLLYELLTGTTPLESGRLKQSSLLEVLRIIREEEPPKPSLRLSATAEPSYMAASRGLDPRKLSGQVRGELDWIVMKSLEKERDRRYETANSLALDLQRYLRDEPVLACPPSLVYRLGKVIRRHKGPVLAAALVLVALVVGVSVSVWQAVLARVAQHQAEANLRKAHQAVNDYFTLVSESTLFDQPTLEPFRKDLLQSALRYYHEFVREHGDDPRLRAELAATYFRIAVLTYDLGPEEDWLPPFQKCVTLVEEVWSQGKPDPAAWQSFEHGIYRVNAANAGMIFHVRRPDEALQTFEKARALWEELAQAYPEVSGFRSDLAVIHLVLGTLYRYGDRPAEAAESYGKAGDLWEGLVRAYPGVPHHRAALAVARSNLSLALAQGSQLTQAEEACRSARETARQLAADFPDVPAWQELHTGTVAWQLGGLQEHAGWLEEAEETYRQMLAGQEALSKKYPGVARYQKGVLRARLRLGGLLWDKGLHAEAKETYRQAAALGATLSPEDPEAQNLFAWFLTTCLDPEFRDTPRAVTIAQKVVESVPKGGFFWLTLGAARYRAGEFAGAVVALEKAIHLPGAQDSRARFYLAMVCWRLGKEEQARRWFDEAVARMEGRELKFVEVRRLRVEAERVLGVREPRK